jgi:hypothetical protein
LNLVNVAVNVTKTRFPANPDSNQVQTIQRLLQGDGILRRRGFGSSPKYFIHPLDEDYPSSLSKLDITPPLFHRIPVPQIHTFGEMCIFFVNRTAHSIVHNEHKTSDFHVVSAVTPLHLLRYVLALFVIRDLLTGCREDSYPKGQFFDDKLKSKQCDFCNPVSEQQRGKQELVSFATKSLNALIDQEERGGTFKSDLQLFCRMDVGVMYNVDSELHYFINGVYRTLDATLFMTKGDARLMDIRKAICQELVYYMSAFVA